MISCLILHCCITAKPEYGSFGPFLAPSLTKPLFRGRTVQVSSVLVSIKFGPENLHGEQFAYMLSVLFTFTAVIRTLKKLANTILKAFGDLAKCPETLRLCFNPHGIDKCAFLKYVDVKLCF